MMAQQGNFHQGFRSGFMTLVCLALSLMILIQGCATLKPRNPLPQDLESEVNVPGMPGVRAWGDEASKGFTEFALESIKQERATLGKDFVKKPAHFLALSGGGDDGAFGAGVLCGWTAHGNRPQFKLVTGISTGALIAPFAFLGSSYDDTLRHLYTGITSEDIFKAYCRTVQVRPGRRLEEPGGGWHAGAPQAGDGQPCRYDHG
jgi:hypothetical protein